MNILSDKSVLIIDDDPGMLQALEKVLTQAGMRVSRATWVRDGIKELREHSHPFHLVISDLRMPMASGLMILHAVGTAYPGVPVIMITAYGSPEMDEAWWREQGAAAYLEKPINTELLIRSIERVLTDTDQISD